MLGTNRPNLEELNLDLDQLELWWETEEHSEKLRRLVDGHMIRKMLGLHPNPHLPSGSIEVSQNTPGILSLIPALVLRLTMNGAQGHGYDIFPEATRIHRSIHEETQRFHALPGSTRELSQSAGCKETT